MNVRTYEVTVEREGRWWLFRIPELDLVGQARKLAEVDYEARGIIEAMTDADFDLIATNVTVTPPDELWAAWKAAELEEAAARQAQADAAAHRREVVRKLRSTGVTAEEAGIVLGITKQRVFQLEKTPA
ncbi:antitoxin HicB [Clavibacter michiganensis]|uniref:antitoxin HicB n=1 Tax=Clavibacter michiganensis TaxID=28447 RepID=UPI0026DBF47A|nr:antitoxin HicB [Clavibacter michiganensis]MDO4055072.1 antitoxin HicB [Clavibacter michiganensis]MDO4070385.1 antitoxin HicB [Clavibacter michiganensis]MDO4073448.1 antitoxin HicB [Clavibacter michiganensis]